MNMKIKEVVGLLLVLIPTFGVFIWGLVELAQTSGLKALIGTLAIILMILTGSWMLISD